MTVATLAALGVTWIPVTTLEPEGLFYRTLEYLREESQDPFSDLERGQLSTWEAGLQGTTVAYRDRWMTLACPWASGEAPSVLANSCTAIIHKVRNGHVNQYAERVKGDNDPGFLQLVPCLDT